MKVLYAGGDLSEDTGADDEKLQKMLRYIGSSTEANITDDATRELDSLVRHAKHKKDIGVRYMKSWEILNDAKEEGREEMREIAESERRRADEAEARVRELEKKLAMAGVL